MLSLLLCIKILQNRQEIDARKLSQALALQVSDWTEKNLCPESG
jgi:hypothetical protein